MSLSKFQEGGENYSNNFRKVEMIQRKSHSKNYNKSNFVIFTLATNKTMI
jgi:hypothetical protein